MYELQIAIAVALQDAGLTVYDRPPQVTDPSDNSQFPYVTIGQDEAGEWGTDTETGFDVTVRVHTWSRLDFLELKEMQDAVYSVLHRADLDVGDYMVAVGCDETFRRSLYDPDGVTCHGVQDYRVTLTQLSFTGILADLVVLSPA
jgi:hypothetical protein